LPRSTYDFSPRRTRRHPGIGHVLTVAALALFLCNASAQEAATKVLVIHSNQRPTVAAMVIEDTLRKALPEMLGRPVDIFSEYLDEEWTSVEAYGQAEADFLKIKYGNRNIGVIVASAPQAVQFATIYRDRMLPAVPVVHIALASDSPQGTNLPADIVGRPMNLDPADTLQLMLRMHPDATRLVMIIGTAERDRAWERRLRAAAKGIESGVAIDYWVGRPTAETVERVRALPPGTVVFTPGYFADGTGQIAIPRRSVERIAEASSVPVYGPLDTYVGAGVVGGYVTPYVEQAKQAATIAAQLIKGTSTRDIDVSPLPKVAMLDWRQLQRWQIPQARWPADAVIMYREPSIWQRYNVAITLAVAIFLIQSGLIAALLVQRFRRRRAEASSFALAGRLLTAQEDERRRLARDLHDDVTQRLARLAIDAGRMERDAGGIQAKVAARAVREDLVRLSEDVHGLSYQLHPSMLDDLGLAEGLRAECDKLSRQAMIEIHLDIGDIPKRLPRDVSLCLFRVAQEAMRNVVRHAEATKVDVTLAREGRGVSLAVRDDGRGFDTSGDEHASLGRVSMRERVRQVGGRLRIDSKPGGGTTVKAWAPLTETAS